MNTTLFRILLVLAVLISAPYITLAETSDDNTSIRATLRERAEEARAKFRAEREAVRETAREDRAEFKTEREDIRDDHRDSVKAIMADDSLSTSSKREMLEDKREERKGLIDSLRRDRIEAYAERIARRLTAAIERIESLITRTEERLAKRDAEGANTEAAKTLISDAKTSVSDAKIALADFRGDVGELVSTSSPAQAFVNVKDAAGVVITEVKEAHAAIIKAITSMKSSVKTSSDDSSESSE